MLDKIHEIMDILKVAGLCDNFTLNPHFAYGLAQHRHTRYREDRIYGILQVYDLRVGRAIRPWERPSLEELVDEFGLEINMRSLVTGQLFLHTSPERPRRTWCITEQSTVPVDFRHYEGLKTQSLALKTTSGSLIIAGQSCPFANFSELHDADIHQWTHAVTFAMRLYLDQHVDRDVNPDFDIRLPYGSTISRQHHRWDNHPILGRLSEAYAPENILVLRLGELEGSPVGYYTPTRGRDYPFTVLP